MVYVFLADGFEEIEAVTPIDILRRAGLTVKTAAVGANPVTGAHGMRMYADMDASQARIDDAQAVLLPGGMPGTTNLENSEAVRSFLRAAVEKGVYIGAICAAPSILGHMGLLEGKRATCFPGFEGALSGAAVTRRSGRDRRPHRNGARCGLRGGIWVHAYGAALQPRNGKGPAPKHAV